ncbi:uncharacterized protein [Mycetomoellerius zeteki]|uniref:uncharacterized protein n=1 Tax=Mycetomoellerius zeteki TaxID=64791 RepID=UPI00084E6AB7|nr:PREDICTED: uncharacterized protein LOC108721461 [Trachymyrmex zeteki]
MSVEHQHEKNYVDYINEGFKIFAYVTSHNTGVSARTRASWPLACACKVEDQSKRAATTAVATLTRGGVSRGARVCLAIFIHANEGSIALHSSTPGDTEGLNCEIENLARRCDQLFNNGDLGGTMDPGASMC